MNDKKNSPLYNTRIFQSYLDYLSVAHPHIRTQELLDHSGITIAEMADSAHWFTQEQADQFYQIVIEKTGDKDIARKAGRFSATSAGMASFQQYVIGLMNTETALLSVSKILPLFTKGATIEAKKIAPGKVEIISTPKPAVEEKPYQCENRLGTIEACPKLFTNIYGHIDHPKCFHRGDEACRYIVSWTDPSSLKIKLWRNYTLLGSVLLAGSLLMIDPPRLFAYLAVLAGLNAGLAFAYSFVKIRELEKIIETGHSAAEERIEMARVNYNNSILVQEIGHATAAILTVDELMAKLAALMQHRLSFDRGIIMLADEKETKLVYTAGYGYAEKELDSLKKLSFQLNKPDSKGFFVRAFLDRQHRIITNAQVMADELSPKSRKLLDLFGVRALLCLPIVYKDKPFGILAVDNVNTKTPLKKSDINLLEGIASHIAICINNARSFEKLQKSENRYRQTIESIEEGYFEIDLNKKLLFFNKAFGNLVGKPWDELLDSSFQSFFTPDSARLLFELCEKALESKNPVRFAQLELRTVKEKTLPVDLSMTLIADHTGQTEGFRGFVRNALDRLQLETERKELEKKFQQSQKMEAIGTLAGGIAHNFNNWLAGILGNIDLIKMAAQGQEKLLDRLFKIEKIIDNASKMNRQLLSYARGGNYEIKPTDLNELIKEVSDTLAAARKDIVIKLALEAGLHTVEADRSQLEQVLWNFYVNAAEAMPDGGTFRIDTANLTTEEIRGLHHEIPPGDYVSISCTDTGTGITPEHMETIFEPFFTTKTGKGTGLGLASCYGIIKAHNGYVHVVSEVGAGSTFTMYLPSVAVVPESTPQHVSTAHKGRGTILVIDDEEMVLETNVALLSSLGYTAYGASSGAEVFEKYADRLDTFDIVIIDMIMPGISGGELFGRLKKLKPDIKTILSSGYSLNQNIQAILDQGCEGFLQKPFSLGSLATAIEKILVKAN